MSQGDYYETRAIWIKIVANFLVGLVICFTQYEDLIHMICKSVNTATIIVVFLDAFYNYRKLLWKR